MALPNDVSTTNVVAILATANHPTSPTVNNFVSDYDKKIDVEHPELDKASA